MPNHGTTLVDGRYVRLQQAVLDQLPRDFTTEAMDAWLSNKEGLNKALRGALMPTAQVAEVVRVAADVATGTTLLNWRMVYEKLGLAADLEQFLARGGNAEACADQNTWAVPVLRGVTPNRIVQAFRDLGVGVWLYVEDLDTNVRTNDRDPKKGSYVVRFKKNIEADPENANQSANDRKRLGAKDIILLERLLLELGYFLTTGNHLDVVNITLCSGSRSSGGSVPNVRWHADNRELCVDWYNPDRRHDGLRARAAVS